MARGVNKAIILGHVGKIDKHAKGESIIVRLSMATNEKWKDKATGEMKENTEWHNVVIFGKLAEIADKYVEKGSQIFIEGKLRTTKYTDDTGVDRYSTQIIAENMQLLGKSEGGGSKSQPPVEAYDNMPMPPDRNDAFYEDSIPF